MTSLDLTTLTCDDLTVACANAGYINSVFQTANFVRVVRGAMKASPIGMAVENMYITYAITFDDGEGNDGKPFSSGHIYVSVNNDGKIVAEF